jgi:UDP-2-acetamido-2,6-beta-L-arabino-hexul-4-ose reductase
MMNVGLAAKLVLALEATNSKAHLFLFSQEERDNLYGKSKRNRVLLYWAKKRKESFTGLIIPNVFWTFWASNYNSVVATFSHKMARNETYH